MIFYLDRQERVQAILTNNGSPESCPYYDDVLKESLETGTSSYEFKIPSNHPVANEIEEDGFIVRKDLDGNLIMFTIIQIEEAHAGMSDKYIYAENTGLELLNDILRPVTHMSKNANQILDIVLADSRWVRGTTEYMGVDNFYFEDYQIVLSALQYVAEKFTAELRFRVKMKNGKVTARYVDLIEKRGTDTKKRFSYNKDINSIRRKIDMSNVVTALIGVGKAGSNGTITTFKSIGKYLASGDPYSKPLNQDWVGDSDALQKYGNQGRHLFGVFKYETTDPADLLNRTWAELQKRKNPAITYELDVALLERLAGLEHEAVRIGDTVYIIDETFSPALYLEARIIALETCFSDPSKDKCALGNYKKAKSNITKDMRSLQAKMLYKEATWDQAPIALQAAQSAQTSADTAQTTANTAQTSANTAQQTASSATQTANNAMTSASGKNKVYRQSTKPTGSFVAGDMWFDTGNGNRLSVWDGTTWVLSKFGDAAVSNLDAGSITTGTLRGIEITGGTIYVNGLDGTNFLYTNAVDVNPVGEGVNVYVRPTSAGELRVTVTGTTDSYRPVRTNGIATGYTNLYLQGAEVRVVDSAVSTWGNSHTYSNLRAAYLFADALDVNGAAATNLYIRPRSGGEVRATVTGSTTTYVDFRCKTVYRDSEVTTSDMTRKKNITDYTEEALSQILNTPIREYHMLEDLDEEKKRLGIIMQEAPVDVVDIKGYGVETYAMIAMSWKAIQELAQKIENIESRIGGVA
jgi:phage minor structural protein